MKISIITPTFNSGLYIRETMESIHNQSYKNFEHIVVDGLSKDNTLEIVNEFGSVHLISEKDKGQSDAINKGFKKSNGDIIAWQNGDDKYLPHTFERIINFFMRNPGIDIVYGDYQLIDSNSNWICDVSPIQWSDWLFKHGRFVPLQPTVFWRRRVLEKVGLLNENLHYCMDVDYFSRMLFHGFRFAKITAILGQFRVHQESKTQNSENERKVRDEHRRVLSNNFNYNYFDNLIFDFFQSRAVLVKKAKMYSFKRK